MTEEYDLPIEGGAWGIEPADAPVSVPVLDQYKLPDGQHPWILLPGAPARADVEAPNAAPWAGIVLIEFFYKDSLVRLGTGFFVDQHVIVTARHNLEPQNYDKAGVWAAFDAQRNPQAAALTIRSNARHPVLDIAVLLTQQAGPGRFGMDAAAPAPPPSATVAGYAFPYPNGSARLSHAAGPVSYGAKSLIGYKINTRPGDSGAPVFHTAGGTIVALGIHTEAPIGSATMNAGIRFTPAVLAEINKLIAYAQEHA